MPERTFYRILIQQKVICVVPAPDNDQLRPLDVLNRLLFQRNAILIFQPDMKPDSFSRGQVTSARNFWYGRGTPRVAVGGAAGDGALEEAELLVCRGVTGKFTR